MNTIQTIKAITGHNVKLIGRGEWSKAYRSLDDSRVVFILSPSDDYVKDIISHCEGCQNAPVMNRIDDLTIRGADYTLWQTEYTHCPTKDDGNAYIQWKTLNSIWDNLRHKLYNSKKDQWYIVAEEFVDLCREDTTLDSELVHTLDRITVWCSAYGPNYTFEFPRCNLGVNDQGILILRDVVFFR